MADLIAYIRTTGQEEQFNQYMADRSDAAPAAAPAPNHTLAPSPNPAHADQLLVLPNIKSNQLNFFHERDKCGTLFQNTRVTTIVRIGVKTQQELSGMDQIEMHLINATTNQPITPEALKPNPKRARNELYAPSDGGGNFEAFPPTQSLTGRAPSEGEEFIDNGEMRRQCAGEATFKFKFNITAHNDIVSSPEVYLRFQLQHRPEIFVDTPVFKLVRQNTQRGRPVPASTVRLQQPMPPRPAMIAAAPEFAMHAEFQGGGAQNHQHHRPEAQPLVQVCDA